MRVPPPGYDDDSVIAHRRLVLLVDKLEHELLKIEKVALKNLSITPYVQGEFENSFWQFRHSAEELGAEYSRAVEKLIHIYSQFLSSPSDEKLSEVMKELSHLKSLLEKH